MPFLYYFGFVGVLVTAFVASAFLRGGETPTVAAVGRASSDTAPLEKLHREIVIRRGGTLPQQEEPVEVKITPLAVQTETAAVTPARPTINEIKPEVITVDSTAAVAAQPAQMAPVKRPRHKEAANKCGPGGCKARQARFGGIDAERTP